MRWAADDYADAAQADMPRIEWEETACLLCGGAHWAPFLEGADPRQVHDGLRFQIVRCFNCDLAFTNPRPNADTIRQFYPADYPCHAGKDLSLRERRQWLLSPFAPRKAGLSRLLDFGCGAGDFLRRMHALGWNVTGIDRAEAAVANLRRRHGLPAVVGTLPQPEWADASFEAITMWQALEHVHDPLAVLRDARRLLTPGGRLIVTVPNLDSMASRWFHSSWYGLDLPRHLTHFTSGTLLKFLQSAGFQNIVVHQEQHGSWIRHSAQLAQQRDGPTLLTKLLQSRIGSGLAARWGRWTARAESLLAIVTKG